MDETIIFIYADHGEAIPRGKTGSVGIGYKVPLIVWFPEKYQHLSPWGTGAVSNELVNFDDLGPTVLSLAGIKAPEYMTGRPIMGRFREAPEPFLFTSRNRIDETPGLTRSITDGKLMYSKVFTPQFPELEYQKYADVSDLVQQIREDHKEGKLNELQAEMLERRNTSEYLYDLESDPWKLNNLADDEEYVEKVIKLKRHYTIISLRYEMLCIFPNIQLINCQNTLLHLNSESLRSTTCRKYLELQNWLVRKGVPRN